MSTFDSCQIFMNCKLCQNNPASKIKSHYISKFLGKDLFNDGYTLQIKKDFTRRKLNDIPKDQFIFCNGCEEKLLLIEGIVSRDLSNIDKKENFNNLFSIKYEFGNQVLSLNRNSKIFNLFVISLIWRASISNHILFEKFSLPTVYENQLREILINFLCSRKDEYDFIPSLDFDFKYVMIKPEYRNQNSRGHFSTASTSKNIHMLFLVNFYICLYLGEELIPLPMYNYCNSKLENFVIILSENDKWKNLNKIALDQIFNKK